MGLSTTAHGALIGMTKLINWTPLFQGTGPQDFYYEHTLSQLTSDPFNGVFSHCAESINQYQSHVFNLPIR